MSVAKKVARDSNFELLRIILIVMIIGLHYLGHGGALIVLTPSYFNYYIANALESFFIAAVNCFILITGYYQINGTFKIKKLINLWAQVLFYSITISTIFWSFNLEPFTIKGLFYSIFPLITRRWWFITLYMVLFIISPYINESLHKMDRITHEKLLLTLLILFVILPTILPNNIPFNQDNGYSLYNFVFLYCLGSYIRLYNIPANLKINYIGAYLISSLLILTVRLTGGIVPLYLNKHEYIMIFNFAYGQVFHYNFILVEISALFLFLSFRDLKIKSNQNINAIATSVFGIYLISDHPYVRDILYSVILKCDHYYYNPLGFLGHFLCSIAFIFIFCIVIEFIRQILFKNVPSLMHQIRPYKKFN